MNITNAHPGFQRFEQKFTEQVKIDKVVMQRHKICAIVGGVAAAALAASIIAVLPVMVAIAGVTAVTLTAGIVTGIALSVLFVAAIHFATGQESHRTQLMKNHKLTFLMPCSDLRKETPALITSLIRYGLVSDKVADKLSEFKNTFEASPFNATDVDMWPEHEEHHSFCTEWESLVGLIRNDIPFPRVEDKNVPRSSCVADSKLSYLCDYDTARSAALHILKSV